MELIFETVVLLARKLSRPGNANGNGRKDFVSDWGCMWFPETLLLVDFFDVGSNQIRHPHRVFNQFDKRFVFERFPNEEYVAIVLSAANDVRDLRTGRKKKRHI